MKRLMIAAMMTLIGALSLAHAADAAVPLPQPRPIDNTVLAQAAPKYEFRDRTAEVVPPAAPSVQTPQATAPIVVTAPGAGLHDWANNGLLGLISGLLVWLGIKKPAAVGGTTTGDAAPARGKLDFGKVSEIVTAALHPSGASIISDPDLREKVDAALFKAVQSGIPGQALQTGLSFIPGAGPIVTTVEPIVRQLVTKFLQEKVGTTSADPAAVHAETDNRLSAIEGLLKGLAAKLHDKPAAA